MSENIEQIFIANPITTNASTDLMYFGQSPYGSGDDAAMTYANFSAQIVASGTANDLAYYASTGGALSALATADSAMLTTSAAGVPAWTGSATNGELLIGSTGATPALGTITAGAGIAVTNGAASITISSTGGGLGWVAQASTPVTAAVNTGYVITDASTVTVTLPAVAAVGSVVRIAGEGAGGWVLAPGAGQTIKVLTASASTSVASTEQYDCIEVVCVTANTTWVTLSMVTTGFTIT